MASSSNVYGGNISLPTLAPAARRAAAPVAVKKRAVVPVNYGSIFTGDKLTDPQKALNDQWKVNKTAADYSTKIGAVNQFSPYGSMTYTRDPVTGVPTGQTVKLSQPLQQTFNRTNATRNELLNTTKNVGARPWELPDTSRAGEVEKTLFNRKWNLVSPELDQAQARLDRSLVERGLPVGSEIYNTEMDRTAKARGETLAGISQDATLAGGAEEDRLLRNSLAERAQPFNELAGFTGGTQIGTPQFGPTTASQVSAPDYTSLYTNQKATDQAQKDSFWNGLLGIGKAGLGALAGGPVGSAVANWLF